MKEDLSLLIELQECDTRLVSLLASKKNLPEKMTKLEQDFLAFSENIEQNKRKYEEIKNTHTAKEKDIKKINEGIVKAKERLLEVKNNKEYQAMLKEIETAELSRGEVETGIISLLDEMDKLAVLVKKDGDILKERQATYEQEKKNIEDDLNAVDTDVVQLEQKKTEMQKSIPGELLTRYERIKKRSNGSVEMVRKIARSWGFHLRHLAPPKGINPTITAPSHLRRGGPWGQGTVPSFKACVLVMCYNKGSVENM